MGWPSSETLYTTPCEYALFSLLFGPKKSNCLHSKGNIYIGLKSIVQAALDQMKEYVINYEILTFEMKRSYFYVATVRTLMYFGM